MKDGSLEVGSSEVGSLEVGFLEVGSLEVGSLEVGFLHVGFLEVGSLEVRIVQLDGSILQFLVDPVIFGASAYDIQDCLDVGLRRSSVFPRLRFWLPSGFRAACRRT